jgi:carboxymethylenebutenolidase
MITDEQPIDIATPTGTMRVHLHAPAGAAGGQRFPGVVLYSEIYQQTAPIRRAAIRLSSHGYLVAVPEVFHDHEPPGTVLAYDKAGTDRGNQLKYETTLSSYDQGARAALDLLRDHPRSTGKLGAIGWCLGGHLAFRAALQPDVLATACFYATDLHSDSLGAGKKSDSLARLGEIRGEVMMVWGRQDPHVPDEGRALIHAALRHAGLNHTWHEFNAAHAFMRDEGPRYDPALAAIGWALVLETFERSLKNA